MLLQSTSSDLPTSFINNILNADIEKIVFTSDKEYIYFAIVDSIEIPDNISTIQDIKLTSEIKNAFGNEIFKTKNISINDELISGLLSQYK